MNQDFKALIVNKGENRTFSYGVKTNRIENLPDEEVLVRVHFSSINYKDCMSCQGNPAVTRRFPHTPGLDAAGVVEQSANPAFKPGDEVIITSTPMGMNTPGGFGQFVRVPSAWLMKNVDGLSLQDAMAYGTAGYTAALSVEALQNNHDDLDQRTALVTGATGGVGCFSVALLSALGCTVSAVTGQEDAHDFLRTIGAKEVLSRTEFEDTTGRNLLPTHWDAAIDVAGGNTLATALKSLNDNGVAVATGMIGDTALQTTVLPFILRGTRLIGINAENTSHDHRRRVWTKLATTWKPKDLSALYRVVALDQLPKAIDTVLKGTQWGRIVVDLR
ncbi:YhdH/YhfP family quinone oxidoreductase [Magnetovibrio sp. PR-2]|uniref:YhdH/YhfP family quinone oxidoreductase n=1 Tax=Magnetovibrio sp. PR-2 TaxID=3120356 RepID=UPI002FCE0BF2